MNVDPQVLRALDVAWEARLLKVFAASLIPMRLSQDEVAVAKGIGEEGGNTLNRGWILIAANCSKV